MAWASAEEEQESDYVSCDGISISDDEKQIVQQLEEVELQDGGSEDGDSDIDADAPRAHGPKTTSEKRRAQNNVLKAFAANISAYVTQQEVEETATKSTNEEQLSIQDILAKQETTVRITNPRDYQTELFQRAKCGNIIAVLDTGSGKTHIATLLLKHVLDEELDNRAKGGVPKTAFFLVRYSKVVSYTC